MPTSERDRANSSARRLLLTTTDGGIIMPPTDQGSVNPKGAKMNKLKNLGCFAYFSPSNSFRINQSISEMSGIWAIISLAHHRANLS
jgi:hypothetical protein